MHTGHTEHDRSERINIRLAHGTKQKIEQAAALDHRSVTSFIIASAISSADEILKRNEQITLSDEDWDIFYNALINPPKPNEALKKAFIEHKGMKID